MKKGFTLVEVLVAIFIFVLIIIAAYQIYERSQRTYYLGEQLSDLQQNIRFAYEQISRDLRIAGYGVYPDDESTRPDEPIEGMWSGAIAIRANFDEAPAEGYGCIDGNKDNLCDSGTGAFRLVSTSNQEIVIYALAKKPNDPNGETISFLADLSIPRDAVVGNVSALETITVSGISLAQNDPPYTLYRITISENADLSDRVASGNDLVWTPIASNIYSLRFTYYTENGIDDKNIIQPDENDIREKEIEYLRKHGFPFGGTTQGICVKNVVFRLAGVTQNPDPKWSDPNDPYEKTKKKRKIEMVSTINMPNVGIPPHELADTVPPDAPTELRVTTGYCNGALFTWNPSYALDVTAYYIQFVDETIYDTWGNTFKYNCDDFPSTCYVVTTPEAHPGERIGWFVPGMVNNVRYYSRVYSQDRAGNFSIDSTNTFSYTVTPNPIKPKPPDLQSVFEGKDDNKNRLFIQIGKPVGYESSQPNDCKEPPNTEDIYFDTITRDFYGYRLYHKRFVSSNASDFTIFEDGHLVANEKSTPPLLPSTVPYPDKRACPCEYYAYKAKSVTTCAVNSFTGSSSCNSPQNFISEPTEITKDESGQPIAYFVPELENPGEYPKIVPGKPATPIANVSGIAPDYNISLVFYPVFETADLNSDGTYSENFQERKIECWRYKVYLYDTYEDALNDTNAQEILDQDISGIEDGPDWDAGIDGGKEYLRENESITIQIGQIQIPEGEQKFIRFRGYYKCPSGDILGKLSEPIPIPCVPQWSAEIIFPPFDNALLNETICYGVFCNITLKVTGIGADEQIQSVTFYSPNMPPYQTTCEETSPGTCTATFPWNILTLSDGVYTIIAEIRDNKGCSKTVQRTVNLNRTCSDFRVQNISRANDELTFQLYKTTTGITNLLKGLRFKSQNYLYENIKFYESTPFSGNPTAYILWQTTDDPVDLNMITIGKDYTIPYTQTNPSPDCGYYHLYPDTSNPAKENWFRINFDRVVGTDLNLAVDFHFNVCGGSYEAFNGSIPSKAQVNINFTQGFVCSYSFVASGSGNKKAILEIADLCNGFFRIKCGAPSGSCGNCTLTLYYVNQDIICENIAIPIQ